MKLNSLEDLFLDLLRDIYYAEKQITKALPKMAKKASSEELRMAFEEHLQETETQIERLDQVFEAVGQKPRAKKCPAMDGLVAEAKELMEQDAEPSVLDAGLIVSAQKVEHYEIAAYGSLRTFAEQLGYEEAAELLQETLDEEAATDEKLTELAEANEEETAGVSGKKEDEEEA
jgi:ferritin-like metal-binding protein YciE